MDYSNARFKFVEGLREGSRLLFLLDENQIYCKNKYLSSGETTYRCRVRGCKARIYVSEDETRISAKHLKITHKHGPQDLDMNKMLVVGELKKRCTVENENNSDTKQIFNDVLNEYATAESEIGIVYESCKRTLQRKRKPVTLHLTSPDELRTERKHKNSIQDDFFMKFMSENPEMAKGFVKGDRITTDAKWADLTKTLNSAGPPTKDIQGWKKAWSDWKVTIKKKLAHNRRESTTSDGGPFVQLMLSPIETTIAGLCGLSKVVEGFDDSISNFVVEKAAEGHLLDNRENGEESNSKKRPNSEIEEPPSTSSEAQMSWQRKRRVPPLPPGNMEELYSAQNQLMLRVASSLDGIRDHLEEQNRLMAQHFLKMEEIALTKLELQQRTHSL